MKSAGRLCLLTVLIMTVLMSVSARAGRDCPLPDSKSAVGLCEKIAQPVPEDAGVRAGEYVFFGRYPQTASGDDDTPVEWLVLEVRDGKALLLSRYGLDSQKFDRAAGSGSWIYCSVRTWLNETFFEKTFTPEEQRLIVPTAVDDSPVWNTPGQTDAQDHVFLLSYAEADRYFGISYENRDRLRTAPTDYAKAAGAYSLVPIRGAGDPDEAWWWLRSPGKEAKTAAAVNTDGTIRSVPTHWAGGCVRPAIWVTLVPGLFR